MDKDEFAEKINSILNPDSIALLAESDRATTAMNHVAKMLAGYYNTLIDHSVPPKTAEIMVRELNSNWSASAFGNRS